MAAVPVSWPAFLEARRQRLIQGRLIQGSPSGAPDKDETDSFFSEFYQVPGKSADGHPTLTAAGSPPSPLGKALEARVLQVVRAAVSQVTGSRSGAVDGWAYSDHDPLAATGGLDTLGAVELRNHLEAEFGLALSPTMVRATTTCADK